MEQAPLNAVLLKLAVSSLLGMCGMCLYFLRGIHQDIRESNRVLHDVVKQVAIISFEVFGTPRPPEGGNGARRPRHRDDRQNA